MLAYGLFSLVCMSPAFAQTEEPAEVTAPLCEGVGELKPICDFKSPEDIEVIPQTKTLLVSQFGGIGVSGGLGAGSLAAYNTETKVKTELFPLNAVAGVGNWGEKDCKFPGAEFSPHGIHLSKRDSGRLQLLVVNHGGRESVEFFEVLMEEGAPRLSWRGYVYQWYPRLGIQAVPGTYGALPNGLQVSKDGQYLFINMYTGGGIRKVELATGKVAGRAYMRRPDNSSWLPDGRLLVASHVGNPITSQECSDHTIRYCGLAFKLIAVDPKTMKQEVIFENEGAPMGSATVGVLLGTTLYMGSFIGDRILTAPWLD